jgi:hypothetical protein
MLKFLCFLALLIFSVPALAQERQAGVGVSFSHSPGTGNGDGLGVRFDLVLPVQDFFTVVAQTQWEREPKLYIGDDSGSAWRSRVEGRIHLADRQADISPFVSVGLSGVSQRTSQYTKSAVTWTYGAGVVIKQQFVPYWKRYAPENKTQNKVSADEFGLELYLPLNDTKWRMRAGIAEINTRFYQPFGPFAGKISTWGLQTHFGVSRVF